MKTKTFFILFLLLGIITTQLSAQNGKDGTGSVSAKSEWDGYYIDIPVNCGGEEIERLTGFVTFHRVLHFQNGILIFATFQYSGEVTSAKTQEVFKVKDVFKAEEVAWYSTGHCNLIGDKGTHYILAYIYSLDFDTFTFVKAVCPGSSE